MQDAINTMWGVPGVNNIIMQSPTEVTIYTDLSNYTSVNEAVQKTFDSSIVAKVIATGHIYASEETQAELDIVLRALDPY